MRAPRHLVVSLAVGLFTIAAQAQKLEPKSASKQNAATEKLALAAAAEYSKKNAGLAVLVYRDGKLIFEQYQNGHTAKKPQHLFSGTKSFVSMAALVAQKEGLLLLDERAADTITEWQGDEHREKITIRHLLNFTSGLKNIDRELHSRRTADKYSASIECPAVRAPGRRFRYGSSHLMAFGELFNRKLAAAAAAEGNSDQRKKPKDFVAYLHDRILDPIGCKVSKWIRDRKGNPALPYGAYMTAREWAKFGQLVLNRGKWGGKQIIPVQHFDECFQGSNANPTYGLNFWLVGKRAHRKVKAIPRDTVSAAGMYKQKLYIMPSKKMLVIRLGRTGARSRFSDTGFLGRLFGAIPNEKTGKNPKRGKRSKSPDQGDKPKKKRRRAQR